MTKAPAFEWRPQPKQKVFLSTWAQETLFGGAAGGGKSDVMLMAAIEQVAAPTYRALILRRTFPELERSVIERSFKYYPHAGGKYNSAKHFWRFPSGSVVEFGHLEYDHSVQAYLSAEYQFIGFEELTGFTERQYRFMRSRLRSGAGLRTRTCGSTNPGDEGHEWVMKLWGPWLNPESKVRAPVLERDAMGAPDLFAPLRYRAEGDKDVWDPAGKSSRLFIPATLKDNKFISEDYAERLGGLDIVTREQMLNGNWIIKASPGILFRRGWFKIVKRAPRDGVAVRFWDRAATEANGSNDPDYTVGVKMRRGNDDRYTIEDIIRFRGKPAEVEATIKQTAITDGKETLIEMSEDPGQAGKFESSYYAKALSGWAVGFLREGSIGNKMTRARPFSAQCEAGNVDLVEAPWNKDYLDECEGFPGKGWHDDQVDASSGAFLKLSSDEGMEYLRDMMRIASNR